MNPQSILLNFFPSVYILVLTTSCLEVSFSLSPDAFGWLYLFMLDPVAQSDAMVAG